MKGEGAGAGAGAGWRRRRGLTFRRSSSGFSRVLVAVLSSAALVGAPPLLTAAPPLALDGAVPRDDEPPPLAAVLPKGSGLLVHVAAYLPMSNFLLQPA